MSNPMNPLRRSRAAAVTAAAFAGVVLLASTATAAATGTLSAGTTTLAPGASTALTATFAGDNTMQFISVDVTPVTGATGSVSIAVVSFSGATTNCVEVTAVQVQCLWNGLANPQNGVVNLTATASADAVGTFRVTSSETSDVQGNAVTSAVAGPVDLVIPAPATTSTTASPTTSAAVTTTTAAAGGATGQLPGTGSNKVAVTSWAAAGLLAAGATVVSLASRRRGNAR